MKTAPATVDDYLFSLPDEQKKALQKLRTMLKSVAPKAEETISSGIPALRYEGKYLVSFGAAKQHVALYVMRGHALHLLKDDLTAYDTSNTVVRFSPKDSLPTTLVKKIVNIRIKEIESETTPSS
jgi:uncharacterized protein YdhG (YjbR/CyaY superfamily)